MSAHFTPGCAVFLSAEIFPCYHLAVGQLEEQVALHIGKWPVDGIAAALLLAIASPPAALSAQQSAPTLPQQSHSHAFGQYLQSVRAR
jgi:hypothetical protein